MCRLPLLFGITLAMASPAWGAEPKQGPTQGHPSSGKVSQATFIVPENAEPGELVKFINRLRQRPRIRFKTRDEMFDYHRRVSHAKVHAANRLWKIGRNDSDYVVVLNAKFEGLSTLGQLGDAKARAEVDEFLQKMSQHEHPVVASTAKRLKMQGVLNCWPALDIQQKAQFMADLGMLLNADIESLDNVRLAANVANIVGGTKDSQLAIELLEDILPRLESTQDEEIANLVPKMQGLLRRLKLPGAEMKLEGATVAGEPLDWDSYRGKVVLIDFWATWCGPCVAELPNIRNNYAKYRAKGFEVVGVSLDESPEVAGAFLKEQEITWATLVGQTADQTGWEHPMAVRYGIRKLPQAFLVDQEGKVVSMCAKGEKLGKLLHDLLGDPAQTAENATAEREPKSVAAKP